MTKAVIIRPYASLPSEGGSNDRYVNLCKKLIGQGAEVELICSDFVHNAKRRRTAADMELNRRELPFLTQLRTLPYRSNLSPARIAHEILFGLSALLHLLGRARADVILIGEPLFGVGWLFIIYGFLFRIPILADVIDLWPEADTAVQLSPLRRIAYGILTLSRALRLRCYRAVSFVSTSYAARLGFSSSNIFYWGSELRPQNPHAPPGEKLRVIYAGSFGVGYDIETALKAAEIIHGKMPGRFQFVFAGSGPQLPQVERAAAAGHIEYPGVLNRENLIRQYEQADIALLPYKRGSMVAMPIKFFDSINFGLYTLTNLDLEAGDIVRREGIGDIYAGGDADSLARNLETLAGDADKMNRVREACARLAKTFAIDEQFGRFARFVLGHARGNR